MIPCLSTPIPWGAIGVGEDGLPKVQPNKFPMLDTMTSLGTCKEKLIKKKLL
jgi:hypothetical protein